MQKWFRIAVLLLLLAIMAGWYIPAQAKANDDPENYVQIYFVFGPCGEKYTAIFKVYQDYTKLQIKGRMDANERVMYVMGSDAKFDVSQDCE